MLSAKGRQASIHHHTRIIRLDRSGVIIHDGRYSVVKDGIVRDEHAIA